MAVNKEKDMNLPSGNLPCAPTMCTIASSVSNLAVTDPSMPHCSMSDPESYCPPKKIRISEPLDEGLCGKSGASLFDWSMLYAPKACDFDTKHSEKEGGKHVLERINCDTKLPSHTDSFAVSLKSGAGDCAERAATLAICQCGESKAAECCTRASDAQVFCPPLTKDYTGRPTQNLHQQACYSETSEKCKTNASLCLSPYYCHVVKAKPAVSDRQGRPLLQGICQTDIDSHEHRSHTAGWVGYSGLHHSRREWTDDLTASSNIVLKSASGSLSDSGLGFREQDDSETAASVMSKEWDMETASVMSSEGDLEKRLGPVGKENEHCVDYRTAAPGLYTEEGLDFYNTRSAPNIDHSKLTSDLAPKVMPGPSSSLGVDLSVGVDGNDDMDMSMEGCSGEMESIANIPLTGVSESNSDCQSDYEMDSSSASCSESCSGTSASSSDSCDDQSASSVRSARIFHWKLRHEITTSSKSPAIGGSKVGLSRKRKKKKTATSKCGAKSNAVDALIGVRRSSHAKVRRRQKNRAVSQGSEVITSRISLPLNEKNPVASSSVVYATPCLENDRNINDLPDILLVLLFSFLPVITRISAVASVCKKWQMLVWDPSLWRRLDLRNLPRLRDDILLRLATVSERVSSLILSDGKPTLLTDQGVAKALQRCPHLTKVRFNRCFFLSDDAFTSVGLNCHQLTMLNLSSCFSVSDKTLLAIGKGCRLLEVFDLGQCNKITDEGVCAVAEGCRHLIYFRLDQCTKLTNRAVEVIADNCQDLQSLHLMSCTLTDDGVLHLTKLKQLVVLDISNVSQLSRRVVEAVTKSCGDLQNLSLSLNRAVDDVCLQGLVRQCRKLRVLSCVACSLSDVGMSSIAQWAKGLEHLDVAWCADITDKGAVEVSDSCPKLRYLGVMRCGLIKTTTIEQLMLRHPHIQYSNFELESRRLLVRAREQGLAL